MKKLINQPDRYVDEALEGLCSAFPGYALTGRSRRVVTRSAGAAPGRVGVVTGGGFGHLPVFAGYVGSGMLSACAVGDVFAGPPADICTEAIGAANGGQGVLCVLGNYGGDRMSFALACDEAEAAGIPTLTEIVADDVASAPPAAAQKRRGVAGMVFAFKTAGAMAESGAPLADVARIANRTIARTRSIGVALSPCLIPGAFKPGFTVADGEVEIGMGIHGEPGVEHRPLPTADDVADIMLGRLLAEAPADAPGRVAVLVNSLGATPLEELLILYRRIGKGLHDAGLTIARPYVGHYATSMEMAGCSLSLLFVDEELESLLAAPTACQFWPR